MQFRFPPDLESSQLTRDQPKPPYGKIQGQPIAAVSPMSPYQQIRLQFTSLTPSEQRSLLQELTALAQDQDRSKPQRSILELEGLGKATWQGIEAQEYVDQERSVWNG